MRNKLKDTVIIILIFFVILLLAYFALNQSYDNLFYPFLIIFIISSILIILWNHDNYFLLKILKK